MRRMLFKKESCYIEIIFYGLESFCPELRLNNRKYGCGVYVPADYVALGLSKYFGSYPGIGVGCFLKRNFLL
jgi:hypothetical protein